MFERQQNFDQELSLQNVCHLLFPKNSNFNQMDNNSSLILVLVFGFSILQVTFFQYLELLEAGITCKETVQHALLCYLKLIESRQLFIISLF